MDQGWTIVFAKNQQFLHSVTVFVVPTLLVQYFLHISEHFAIFCTHQGRPHTIHDNLIHDRQPWLWHFTFLRHNIK